MSNYKIASISSCKLNGVPALDNVFDDLYSWKHIRQHLDCSTDTDELHIFNLQGVYGYNSGYIGKLFNFAMLHASRLISPHVTSYWSPLGSNDFELLGLALSALTRIVPINHLGTFDPKEFICPLEFMATNNSFPSMYSLKTLFCFQPIFDSGCAIYSNKQAKESGFQKWNVRPSSTNDSFTNKGIVWSYFQKDGSTSGTCVMSVNVNRTEDPLTNIRNFKQIIDLKNDLEFRFARDLTEYDTYITGNFGIMLNLSSLDFEAKEFYDMLSAAKIIILNKFIVDIAVSNFILYSKHKGEFESHFTDRSIREDNNTLHRFRVDRMIPVPTTRDDVSQAPPTSPVVPPIQPRVLPRCATPIPSVNIELENIHNPYSDEVKISIPMDNRIPTPESDDGFCIVTGNII